MVNEIDREQHSLLRSDWRHYLKEGLGMSDSERKVRERIRSRVLTGLHDVMLLNQYARDDDIKQIFERLEKAPVENSDQSDILNGSDRELTETHFLAARALVSFAWRGMRACGVDRDRLFEKVIVRGIEDAEADHKGVPHGRVESDIQLETLEAHRDTDKMDPVEKWKRGLGLSSDDIRTLHKRVSEHPEVEETLGRDIGDLIDEYLINDSGD